MAFRYSEVNPIATDAQSSQRIAADSVPVNEEIARRLMAIKLEDNLRLSSLTDDDFEKMCFLLTPYLKECYRTYIFNPSLPPEKKMQFLIGEISRALKSRNRTPDPLRIVYELLYIIKRYRLLKIQPNGGMCKHKATEEFDCNSENIVDQFWRKMFQICENLSDEDFIFLRDKFYGNTANSLTMAEHVISCLYAEGKISENNLGLLSTAFKGMDRTDLLLLVESAQMYPMVPLKPGQKVGLAVIINQARFNKSPPLGQKEDINYLEERRGTDCDESSLLEVWENFGLEVQCYKDLTSQDVQRVLNMVLSKPFTRNVFICCILSHGATGFFFGSDRVRMSLENIYAAFGSSPHFHGIPKLFFIQACQGDYQQTGIGGRISPVQLMRHDGIGDSENLPLYSDMLIGLSTIPGFVSYRSIDYGSVYIQHLVQALKELGETTHLNDIMTSVNCRIAAENIEQKYKQMPRVINQLLLKLYFRRMR